MTPKKKCLSMAKNVAFLGFMALISLPSFSQTPKVTMVTMEVIGEQIEISYDLIGNPDKKVKIDLVIRRDGNQDFKFKPTRITGDIGKGRFVGENRKIIWDYIAEFTPDPNVYDYFAEVTVKPVKLTWLYIAGGGILAAGGATAAILLFGGSDGATPTQTSGFPIPPRP